MKPRLTAGQGRLIRALGNYLAERHPVPAASVEPALVLESIVSQPWSSLTFVGERHRLSLYLAAGAAAIGTDLDLTALRLDDRLVAVEYVSWTGAHLRLGLLTIEHHAGRI